MQIASTVPLVRRIDQSDRVAYAILLGMVAVFGIIEYHEMFQYENVYGAFEGISRGILQNCSYADSPFNRGSVNWYLVCIGSLTFDNTRVMPYVISIGIIPTTFLMIRKYSNNVTALLVSAALCLDLTFLVFDTVPAFMQTWTIFFLASIYFIRKSPVMAGACFWLACFSKVLAIAWLPIILWIILKTERNRLRNITAFFSIVPVFAASVFWFNGFTFYSGWPFVFDFSPERIALGIYWLEQAFRWESHLLIAVPTLLGYYGYAKLKKKQISITPYMAAVFGVASVFLTVFFTKDGYYPYRLIPNIIMIFYACGYTIRHMINGRHF